MSQKKRVRIYKAGGSTGAYINPTARWMMQMGGASPEEQMMMDPQMMEQQQMVNPQMMEQDSIDENELIELIIQERQQGSEFVDIMNMLLDMYPELDEMMVQGALEQVQMIEEQQGLGEQPQPEDQEFSEADLMKKGGNIKKLRKQFVKEYMEGGVAQGAKSSEVAEEKAFDLINKITDINKENRMRDQAETLAKFVYPDTPAFEEGGNNTPSYVTTDDFEKWKNEFMKNQNQSSVYDPRMQLDPYMWNLYTTGPNTPGYRYGDFYSGAHLFRNQNPWGGGYGSLRYPGMGGFANTFRRQPDTWRTTSNMNPETLKKMFGEDFTFDKLQNLGFQQEVLGRDRATGLRRLLGKSGDPNHIRWSFYDTRSQQPESVPASESSNSENNQKSSFKKEDLNQESNIQDDYKPSSFGERLMNSRSRLLSKIGSKMTPIGDYPVSQNKETPVSKKDTSVNIDLSNPLTGPVATPLDETSEEDSQNWNNRAAFMEGLINSELSRKKYGGKIPRYRTAGQFGPDYNYGIEGKRPDYVIPIAGQEHNFRGSDDTLLIDDPFEPSEEEYLDNLRGLTEIDQKKEKGDLLIDPLNLYAGTMNTFNTLNTNFNDSLKYVDMYSNMSNPAYHYRREFGDDLDPNTRRLMESSQGAGFFESGTGYENKFGYVKRGGSINKKPKYKAGGTYMLEEEVIKNIMAKGGIIKFLD